MSPCVCCSWPAVWNYLPAYPNVAIFKKKLNYINRIFTAPYGRNFRGAGHTCVNDLSRVAVRQCSGLGNCFLPSFDLHLLLERPEGKGEYCTGLVERWRSIAVRQASSIVRDFHNGFQFPRGNLFYAFSGWNQLIRRVIVAEAAWSLLDCWQFSIVKLQVWASFVWSGFL